jgi:purine nucleosidase
VPAVLLDTDIGSDVDDALALAVLLGSPEVELLGVTTVYGDTLLRAQMARRLGRLAGRELTVVPGAELPLSGREVWWAGHEGSTLDRLEDEDVRRDLSGPEFLAATTAERPGEVDVISIGPMTDIALALRLDPLFARNVRRLYVMGGSFARPGGPPVEAEHNIRCDVVAAREVFESDIAVTVTGLDVTTTVSLEPELVDRIAAAGELGDQLHQQILQWLTFWGEGWSTPHDPVTAMSLLAPELFELSEPGRIVVVPDGEHEAVTEWVPDPDGKVRVSRSVDVARVGAQIADRIVAAARPTLGPAAAPSASS